MVTPHADDWKYYYEQALINEQAPVNPLPNWNVPEAWAPAPLHVMSIATRVCVFCGDSNQWDSYQEYIEHFWRWEWEGESYHEPSTKEEFDLIYSLCLAWSPS